MWRRKREAEHPDPVITAIKGSKVLSGREKRQLLERRWQELAAARRHLHAVSQEQEDGQDL